MMYEVYKKICRKTGEVLVHTIRETDEDEEEFKRNLVEYIHRITEDDE